MGYIRPDGCHVPSVLLRALAGSGLVVVTALTGCAGRSRPAGTADGPAVAWPSHGQAAVWSSPGGPIGTSGSNRPAPIASVAKVMTAYLVLREAPLTADSDGFVITVTAADVADTRYRRRLGQSLVAVRTGERLTERQALQALLLPSANNVAAMLARKLGGGSSVRFVAAMNAQARRFGMSSTHYTDPSGYLASTVSTAADQLILARAAVRVPVLMQIAGLRSAELPAAGRVRNTDTLLGRDGFVGLKTGSDDAAGGCLMFVSTTRSHGHAVAVIGVVLGQRGPSLIDAGLRAARLLVDSVRSEL